MSEVAIDHNRDGEFALSRGGRFLALAAVDVDDTRRSASHYLEIWDGSAARRLNRIALNDVVAFVDFDPSGEHVLTIEGNFQEQRTQLRVWDRASGALRTQLAHEEPITLIRFSGQSPIVGTISAGRVYVWHYSSGELLSQIVDDAASLRALQFTPDGRYLLTGAGDGTAALWLWRTADLQDAACERLASNFSRDEWRRYVGDLPYQQTCPNLPADTPPIAP